MAALLIFAQRPSIDVRPRHDADPGALHLADIAGGMEVLGDREFTVTEADVRDALDSALFRSAGPGRFTFAHWTYAEFLAASYLLVRGLPEDRILGLIRHPGFPGTVVPPQLAETAAWLASHSPALFRALVPDNPEQMLRSDVATADPADRALLVDALLTACVKGRACWWRSGRRRLYRPLTHPGLADQLRPWIKDGNRSGTARLMALDIAKACAPPALESDLLALVLDQAVSALVRSHAVGALTSVLGKDSQQALVPVALGMAGDDPNDELRGRALPLVWPAILDTPTMIGSLILSKWNNFSGSYNRFLHSGLLAGVTESDLPQALSATADWVAAHTEPTGWQHRDFARLAAHLVCRGLARISDDACRNAVARLLVTLLKANSWYSWHGELERLHPAALADRSYRRVLAGAMVPALNFDDAYHLLYSPRLLDAEDLPWALEQVKSADDEKEKRLWTDVVWLLWPGDHDSFGVIDDAARSEPMLRERFKPWFEGMPIDGEEADNARQSLRRRREIKERRTAAEQPFTCERVRDLVARRLDLMDQGNPSHWTVVVRILYCVPDDLKGVQQSNTNLAEMAGYSCLDETLLQRLLPAVRQYVEHASPAVEEDGSWWGRANQFDWRADGGVLALGYLHDQEPAFIDALPPEIWARWAPAIVAFTWTRGGPNAADRVFPIALAKAREASLTALRQRVATQLTGDIGRVDFSGLLHGCWDDDLAEAVADAMRDARLNASSLKDGLELLLKAGHPRAGELFSEAASVSVGDDEEIQHPAATVLATVFVHDAPGHWAAVQAVMQRAPRLAHAVFKTIANNHAGSPSAGTLPQLPEAALADIHVFLARQPAPEREPHDDSRGLDFVVEFRNRLVGLLAERGSPEALTALDSLVQAPPDQADWLRWHIVTARRTLAQKSWPVPAPASILELAGRPQARLVRSGEELLEAVLESLGRLQTLLQGETPLARMLWNERGDRDWTPKDENFLSDVVKHHLQADLGRRGAVANREVEIRAAKSAAQGQRTDITVQAGVRHPGRAEPLDFAAVIVEVKGCWHDKLTTAMQAQLRDRYMADATCPFGLYLVGWFVCDRWSQAEVERRKPPAGLTAEGLRHQLDAQAAALSGAGRTLRAFVLDAAIR